MAAPGGDCQIAFWRARPLVHRLDRDVAERVIGEMQRHIGEEDEAGREPDLAKAGHCGSIGAIAEKASAGKGHARHPIWRTVSDIDAGRYFYQSSYSPSIFWVDLGKLKLEPGSSPARLDLSARPLLDGEVSDKFVPAEPFKFVAAGEALQFCSRRRKSQSGQTAPESAAIQKRVGRLA